MKGWEKEGANGETEGEGREGAAGWGGRGWVVKRSSSALRRMNDRS